MVDDTQCCERWQAEQRNEKPHASEGRPRSATPQHEEQRETDEWKGPQHWKRGAKRECGMTTQRRVLRTAEGPRQRAGVEEGRRSNEASPGPELPYPEGLVVVEIVGVLLVRRRCKASPRDERKVVVGANLGPLVTLPAKRAEEDLVLGH